MLLTPILSSIHFWKQDFYFSLLSFQNSLEKEKYEFLLDAACVQFEPDSADFIRVIVFNFSSPLQYNLVFYCLLSVKLNVHSIVQSHHKKNIFALL